MIPKGITISIIAISRCITMEKILEYKNPSRDSYKIVYYVCHPTQRNIMQCKSNECDNGVMNT